MFLMNGVLRPERMSESVNHHEVRLYAKLENNFNLTNKSSLFFNMKKYYEALGRDPFEVIPLTFHIKKGCNAEDNDYQAFLESFKSFEEKTASNSLLLSKREEKSEVVKSQDKSFNNGNA